MRQRVQLLGGTIDVGPSGDDWMVRADVPLADHHHWPPWCPQ
jgi:hypothetical protein